jgi:hypothetical protein
MKELILGNVIFYIGQNCSENDELFESMPNNSTWFHLDNDSSCHVYAISNRKLTKLEFKKGAELVRIYSKKTGKVIHMKKSGLKKVGPGTVELLN